jgi:hypothetical protein
MNHSHASPAAASAAGAGAAPLPATHDFDDAEHYCPIEQLATFALLMAGHGRCVSTDMMLGDRDYAMAQLASAGAIAHDFELARVATRLASYFEL